MLATYLEASLSPFFSHFTLTLYNGVGNLLLTLASGWDIWINLIN